DDIAPLRQIAASVTKPTRARPTDNPNQAAGARADVALASMQPAGATARPRSAPSAKPPAGAAAVPARTPIKPFDRSSVFLFTPAPAYRVHYDPMIGRSDAPEYPPAGEHIDYYLAAPAGDITLDILDTAGKVVRSYSSQATGGQRGRG